MATRIEIMNTIRANASALYQERVPTVTKANIAKVSTDMATYQPVMNEFLTALVNKISMTIVASRKISNPLAQLKKGNLPMGNNIEEIFTNPSVSVDYIANSTDMLKVTKPDVKALYYGINRQAKYPVTISEATLAKAFTNDGAMSSLISSITNSLYSGDNLDEFLLMKQLVADANSKGNVIKKDLGFVPANMTKENSELLIKELRGDSMLLTFPSEAYNSYPKVKPVGDTGENCMTFTPIDEQILLIDSRIYSNVSVDVLASAFNLDKTDFIGKVIPVDDFGGEPVMAMLCDTSWWKVYDNLYKTTSLYNPDTMNYSYWLHHWQVMAYSMFANAIVYTYTIPTP